MPAAAQAGKEVKRLRQKFLPVGTENVNTPNSSVSFQIKTPKPIVAFHFIFRITLTVGTAAGLVEDGINRWIRQIRLTFGGTPIQTIGDNSGPNSAFQMLEPVVRGWLQAVPHRVDVALANGTYGVNVAMPIATPPNRYAASAVNRSALRIGRATTWFLEVNTGALTDFFTTPGTASIDSATLEVVAEVDESLSSGNPENAFIMFSNFQAQAIPAAAGTQVQFQLSTNGIVLFAGYQTRDNGVRNQTVITDLQFRLDGSMIVLEGSQNFFQWLLEFFGDAAANAPTGLMCAFFDNSFTLAGIPAAGSTGWDVLITHLAGTAAAGDGLNGQYYYIRPRGQ